VGESSICGGSTRAPAGRKLKKAASSPLEKTVRTKVKIITARNQNHRSCPKPAKHKFKKKARLKTTAWHLKSKRAARWWNSGVAPHANPRNSSTATPEDNTMIAAIEPQPPAGTAGDNCGWYCHRTAIRGGIPARERRLTIQSGTSHEKRGREDKVSPALG